MLGLRCQCGLCHGIPIYSDPKLQYTRILSLTSQGLSPWWPLLEPFPHTHELSVPEPPQYTLQPIQLEQLLGSPTQHFHINISMFKYIIQTVNCNMIYVPIHFTEHISQSKCFVFCIQTIVTLKKSDIDKQ